jgi:hypothetical protein
MQDAGVLRSFRTILFLSAAFAVLAGCALDRAELYEAGGAVPSEIDDLRVLTYRDDPATEDWTDLVVPDGAILEEGDAFREDDSRTAEADEPAEVRRLFTRIARGRTVLVQLDRASGALQVWEFVDGSDGPLLATGAATADATNEVDGGGYLTVVREADAGEASVVVDGDDDVMVERIATHTPDDGVDLHIDVYLVDGSGRTTVTYEDARGTTDYVVVAR